MQTRQILADSVGTGVAAAGVAPLQFTAPRLGAGARTLALKLAEKTVLSVEALSQCTLWLNSRGRRWRRPGLVLATSRHAHDVPTYRAGRAVLVAGLSAGAIMSNVQATKRSPASVVRVASALGVRAVNPLRSRSGRRSAAPRPPRGAPRKGRVLAAF